MFCKVGFILNLIKFSSAISYIVFAVSIFAAFVNFVVRSVAYLELVRLKKFKFGILAFIPFLQFFVLGKVCDEINYKKNGIRTFNAFWFVFFGSGFCLPSAMSYVFPNLPFFTFESINSSVYFLNCVLFLFNFFFIFFYIDCLRIFLNYYKVVFRKILLICLAVFVILGLDFFVSLFIIVLINRRMVCHKNRVIL